MLPKSVGRDFAKQIWAKKNHDGCLEVVRISRVIEG